MPYRDVGNVYTLTIANNATDSTELSYSDFKGAVGFLITGPSTLPETITVEVSLDEGDNWFTLQSNGSDVNITPGDATPIDFMGWNALRLVAGSSTGGERTFSVGVVQEVGS